MKCDHRCSQCIKPHLNRAIAFVYAIDLEYLRCEVITRQVPARSPYQPSGRDFDGVFR